MNYCAYRRWLFGIPGPQCLNPGTVLVGHRYFCPDHQQEARERLSWRASA